MIGRYKSRSFGGFVVDINAAYIAQYVWQAAQRTLTQSAGLTNAQNARLFAISTTDNTAKIDAINALTILNLDAKVSTKMDAFTYTPPPSISALATTAQLNTAISSIPAVNLTGIATTAQIDAAVLNLKGGAQVDLTDVFIKTESIELTQAAAPTALDIANAVFNHIIENGKTFAQIVRIKFAVLKGKTTGVGTDTEHYLSDDDTKPRITTTFDADNNRTNVVQDGD
jgi:hypothetical protein